MVALPDGRALVFGGVDEAGRYRNDAHMLDSRRLNWISLAGIARGAPPKPRAYHTCARPVAGSLGLMNLDIQVTSIMSVHCAPILCCSTNMLVGLVLPCTCMQALPKACVETCARQGCLNISSS